MQYKEIPAWKCNKCGAVLITSRGIERHKLKCKYAVIPIPGQISMEEMGGGLRKCKTK